jgi:transposase
MSESKRKLKQYSQCLKLQAVQRVLEDGKGVRESGREFKVAHCMVQRWIRLYLDKGIDGLRPTKAIAHLEGESPPPPKKCAKKSNVKGYIESELPDPVQRELRYLRMENAYLKKLSALVRNREW